MCTCDHKRTNYYLHLTQAGTFWLQAPVSEQVIVETPLSTYPKSHVNVAVLPTVSPLDVICPFAGALMVGQVVSTA